MQVKHGSYTGNGAGGHAITGVGFAPDLVIIRRTGNTDVGTVYAYFTVRASASGNAVTFRADTAYETGVITSLDSDGFTLPNIASTNFNGDTYYYVAVRDNGAGDFASGIYTGNGNDNFKAVSGLKFKPDFIVVKANSTITGAFYNSANTQPTGFQWWGGGCRNDLFPSVIGDGFYVSNGSDNTANEVNVNAVEHMWFAFKNVPNLCGTMSFTGNGSDNTNISLPSQWAGMTPVFMILKGNNTAGTQKAVFRFKQNTGDQSQEPDNSVVWSNVIQSFGAGTFQVGSDARANENGTVFSAFFLADDFTTTDLPSPTQKPRSNRPRAWAPGIAK